MSSSLRIHYLEEVSGVRPAVYHGGGFRVRFDDLKELVADAQKLRDSLRALHQSPLNTKFDSEAVQTELACASDSADQLCHFLDTCWERVPVVNRPSAQSAIVAQKVFNLPEVLEMIIGYLDLYDALRAQHVGRVWHDGINSSVKMQRAMGLRAYEGANFFTPLVRGREPWDRKFPGVSFDGTYEEFDVFAAIRDNHIPQTKPVDIRVHTSAPLSVGARCRRILFCQPPLKRATVLVDHYCIHNICSPTMLEHEITSDDGIRFGDVLDAAQEAFDGYYLCGYHSDGMYVSDALGYSRYARVRGNGRGSGNISGDAEEEDDDESGWDSGGNGDGDFEHSAGPDLASVSNKDLRFFTHTDCELVITVHGVVTLKDDDPFMVWRREFVTREAVYQQRRIRFG